MNIKKAVETLNALDVWNLVKQDILTRNQADAIELLCQQNYEPESLQDCHDCAAKPGELHSNGCDTERCSVCGGQRLFDGCKGHDKKFARWTGLWPGYAEAKLLGIDLNEFEKYSRIFFKKPS